MAEGRQEGINCNCSLWESFDGEVYELGLECCATSSFTWATVAAETRHFNFLLAERALDWNCNCSRDRCSR